MNPNHWLTVLSFMTIATLLSLAAGWSINKKILPLKPVMAYSDAQRQFLKVWVNVALIIGIIVPVAMLIGFWEQPIARQFFGLYLLAVMVQLVCESSFSRWLCQSIVVIIGAVYTGFRIWQVWSGLHLVAYPQPWLSLLWLVLLFWVANIIMLITMAFPSIFPESEENSGNPV
jgi:hypothetical protein